MKIKIYTIMLSIIVLGLFSGCTGVTEIVETQAPQNIDVIQTPAAEVIQTPNTETDPGYGAVGSFENPESELEQMLVYAIQDEYLARAEYEFLINELNAGTPFTNIIKAEETHIGMLVPLFEAYGFEVPEDTSADHIISVESITQALEAGVQAEIDNIAMYENFLESDIPDDVRTIFTQLRDASESHLAAFERKLSR